MHRAADASKWTAPRRAGSGGNSRRTALLTFARRAAVPPIVFASLMAVAAGAYQAGSTPPASLAAALTFHASFDSGPDADFGLGDKRIYTAASYKSLAEA